MSALQALFLLPAALILDLLFSEPPARVHPVCGMGYLASRAEPFFRRLLSCPFPPDTEGGSPLREGLAGLLAGLAVILPPAVIAWSLTALAGYSGTAGGFAMAAVSVWLCLAPVSLARHALRVRDAAEAGKTGEARKAVSMIVGRDTNRLDEKGVARAAVETVAENTSDGVIAPLLFLAIGGAPLGFFYKAVNTMDSMLGYTEPPYKNIGLVPAKMDDFFNFLPARLSAFFLLAAGFFLRLDVKNGWRIFRRDRYKHASPNSAQTESVCAGLLGLRLAGDAWYHGVLHKKEFIGDAVREIEYADIPHTCRLMELAAVLALIVCCAIKACFIF